MTKVWDREEESIRSLGRKQKTYFKRSWYLHEESIRST